MILSEIYVENFKSLKECGIKLGKFNVVVGPNASGKSNLVEIFKLLKKIYVERADNPFTEWWGYRNVVSDHKEELPIKIQLKFGDEKNKNEILFEVEISGTGGHFEIVKEIFEVKGVRVRIEKDKRKVTIKHQELGEYIIDEMEFGKYPDSGFYSMLYPIFTYEFWYNLKLLKEKLKNKIIEYYNTHPLGKISKVNLFREKDIMKAIEKGNEYEKDIMKAIEKADKHKAIRMHEYLQNYKILEKIFEENLSQYSDEILNFIKNTVILKDINVTEIKPPINPTKNIILEEDGRNTVNVLYNLFLEHGQVPDGIKTLLSYIFPNTNIKFKLTDDGRILMEISENDLVLLPPSISAGFFKFLTIITALELKPALIVIDELENSLYPKAIDLLMDEFKNGESQVIITTHSPVVVDLVYPDINDLILVKKENGESSFISIEDEEKIRNELDESEITLSEKWLYGRIDKYSDKK